MSARLRRGGGGARSATLAPLPDHHRGHRDRREGERSQSGSGPAAKSRCRSTAKWTLPSVERCGCTGRLGVAVTAAAWVTLRRAAAVACCIASGYRPAFFSDDSSSGASSVDSFEPSVSVRCRRRRRCPQLFDDWRASCGGPESFRLPLWGWIRCTAHSSSSCIRPERAQESKPMPAEQSLTSAQRRGGPGLGPNDGASRRSSRGRLDQTAALLAPVALIVGLGPCRGRFRCERSAHSRPGRVAGRRRPAGLRCGLDREAGETPAPGQAD